MEMIRWKSFRDVKIFFSSFLKKSELISAVWLGGWGTSFEELGRDRDFQFFAIDSVSRRGDSIIKIMDSAPLRVRELLGSKFYMSDFNNMGVYLG
jgi:hypothetical protein